MRLYRGLQEKLNEHASFISGQLQLKEVDLADEMNVVCWIMKAVYEWISESGEVRVESAGFAAEDVLQTVGEGVEDEAGGRRQGSEFID